MEFQPLTSITFIAFTLRCLQEFINGSEKLQQEWEEKEISDESSSTEPPWHDSAKARTFALKLLRRFTSYGAPMLIICSTFQLVVIERREAMDPNIIELDVYTTVLAHGPDLPVEPTDEAAQALLSNCPSSLEHNFVSQVSLLALRADQMIHPSKTSNVYAVIPLAAADAQVEHSIGKRFSETHTLLLHCDFFAIGWTCMIYNACLVPSGEEPSCPNLLHQSLGAPSSCANPRHVRVVVKAARCIKRHRKNGHPDVEQHQLRLEQEAAAYESLHHLQGKAVPFFTAVGEWVLAGSTHMRMPAPW